MATRPSPSPSSRELTSPRELKALGVSAVRNKRLYERSFSKPDPSVLERFKTPRPANKKANAGGSLTVEIETPEFTSLCPLTHQPDFATIVIKYSPDEYCVESKSLKLYFLGFRNHGEFHESCVTRIGNDLVELLNPQWLEVKGKFTPRGGIPFHPTFRFDRRFDEIKQMLETVRKM